MSAQALNLIVHGSSGRMGRQVLKLSQESKSFNEVYPVKRFKDFNLSGDVVIDFSLPEALNDLIQFCRTGKTPLVSGTTGFSPVQMDQLRELSKDVPVLWAPNMSLGVMVIGQFLESLSILSDWDFKISETHHIHKKDRPSGTALRLKESLEKAIGRPLPPPESIREGEVIGDHTILAIGPFEEISVRHQATDRRIFAQGAIRAAQWIVDKKPGFYGLSDMVNSA